jgi:hypothetical protein
MRLNINGKVFTYLVINGDQKNGIIYCLVELTKEKGLRYLHRIYIISDQTIDQIIGSPLFEDFYQVIQIVQIESNAFSIKFTSNYDVTLF